VVDVGAFPVGAEAVVVGEPPVPDEQAARATAAATASATNEL
jgi:hypothetical protein